MATTLKDLAQYTGYSIGTISNYITGKTPVSKEKQVRIEEAITALHYKVNIAARMLKTNEYKTIGILIPDFKNVFLLNVVSHMEQKLMDSGYDMVVLSYNKDAYKEKTMLEYLAQRADVILYVPRAKLPEDVITRIQTDTPIITFDEANEEIICDKILLNNVDAADALMEQLFHKGHRSIGMISGPDTSYTSNHRKQGYYKAFARRNYPIGEEMIVAGDYSKDAGYLCCERLVCTQPDLTAIFVVGYPMTLGALAYLKKSGLEKEITVVGYDASVIADVISPSIGYIYQPYHEIAERAIALALQRASKNMDGFPKFIEITAELRNMEHLPCIDSAKLPAISPTTVAYPICRNRIPKTYLGGRLLDEWQRLPFANDSTQSEEILFSLCDTYRDADGNMVPHTTLQTPMGGEAALPQLIAQEKDAFLGVGYKHTNLSVRVADVISPRIVSCQAPEYLSANFFTAPPQRTVAFHILKTRSIEGSSPYIYLGFRPGVTKAQWRKLFAAQDVEGMLACMHKIYLQEGDVFVAPAGMPHCITKGTTFLSVQADAPAALSAPATPAVEGDLQTKTERLLDAFCYDTYPRDVLLKTYRKEPLSILKTSMMTAERLTRYSDCKDFRTERYTFSQAITLPYFDGYCVLVALKGSCAYRTAAHSDTLEQGRALFLPSEVTELELTPLEGQASVLVCYPTDTPTS